MVDDRHEVFDRKVFDDLGTTRRTSARKVFLPSEAVLFFAVLLTTSAGPMNDVDSFGYIFTREAGQIIDDVVAILLTVNVVGATLNE